MSKYIAQIIINGVSIFTRSFINAYQQALRSKSGLFFFVYIHLLLFNYYNSDAKAGGHTVNTIKNAKPTKFKMQTDEALKILSIERHELNPTLLEEVNFFLVSHSIDLLLSLFSLFILFFS